MEANQTFFLEGPTLNLDFTYTRGLYLYSRSLLILEVFFYSRFFVAVSSKIDDVLSMNLLSMYLFL